MKSFIALVTYGLFYALIININVITDRFPRYTKGI